jgi:adenylate cyclase
VKEGVHFSVAGRQGGADCLRAYFAFEERLQSRASHYESEYGIVPAFKAGVDIGPVMVLEVGEIKREITYLGDVLNTAAGIQGKCNELGANLLISEALYQRFGNPPPALESGTIGEIVLRGREQSVRILSVCRGSRTKVR